MVLKEGKATGEEGIFLVLLALFAVSLLLMIGLAVDGARMSSAHQKEARTTELAALGAFADYLRTNPTGFTPEALHEEKMKAAATRAEEIFGAERNRLMTQPGDNQAASGQIEALDGGTHLQGANDVGTIEPGTYYFRVPPGGCTLWQNGNSSVLPVIPGHTNVDGCPCGAGDGGFVECLRVRNDNDDLEQYPITALRLRTHTHTDRPFTTEFVRDYNGTGAPLQVAMNSEAIATLSPRHLVFVVDQSSSVSGETHKVPSQLADLNASGINWSENAFFLSESTCSGKYTPGSPPADPYTVYNAHTISGYPISPLTCSFPSQGNKITPRVDMCAWDGYYSADTHWLTGMPACRPAGPISSQQRYRSDYECVVVDRSTYDPSATSHVPDNKAVIVERNNINLPTTGYRGPEPLSTILEGINTAVVQMETYIIPGDQIMYIGFDSDVFHKRVIGPAVVGSSDFTLLKKVTDYTDNARRLDREQSMLFARSSSTDLTEGLARAYQALVTLPLADVSRNIVVVFSDSIMNCAHFNGPACPNGTCGPKVFDDTNNFTFPNDIDPFDTTKTFLRVVGTGNPPRVQLGEVAGNAPTGDDNKSCKDQNDSGVPDYDTVFKPKYSNEVLAGLAYNNYINEWMHRKALAEVQTFTTGKPLRLPPEIKAFNESDIELHLFLFGSYIEPHTLLRRGPLGCMNSVQAQADNKPFADTGGSINTMGTTPYLTPNKYASDMANETQGRFNPIRTPCNPADLGLTGPNAQDDCLDGAGVTWLDAQCDTSGVAVGDVITPDISGVTNGGRLICDPYCRGALPQIQDAIKDMFTGSHPLFLVEPPQP